MAKSKREHLQGEALAALRRGMTVREAAQHIGVHASTVHRWLKRLEGETPRQTNKTARKVRPWWENENPEVATILTSMRDRLIALGRNADDPRAFLDAQCDPDPVLANLRKQLQ